MKLFNKSIAYVSIPLFFVISLWAVVFYFDILRELKESVDEGLDNYKRQIVYRVESDSTLLSKSSFREGFFAISPITKAQAMKIRDHYADTLMYMQDADDEAPEPEPVRLLTTAFEHDGNFYQLRIINSMVEEDNVVKELFREVTWLYITLILSIVIINNFVLQRLWEPFYALLRQLKNYRLGRTKDLPAVNTRTREFLDLQQALNELLQHNIEMYEQQKQFVGNASHELQTPLAIITNKLELFVEQGNLSDEQAGSLGDIMQMVEKLVRLNRSLLLLTKIENKQFADDQEISLADVLEKNISDLTELSDFQEVEIRLNKKDDCKVVMDLSLAHVVVANLLKNAIFHNIPQGYVQVDIDQNRIKITNTGIQQPLQKDKLFTRFYKSENSTAGTGLGLAIVKAICSRYGFKISYSFDEGLHCFEISIR